MADADSNLTAAYRGARALVLGGSGFIGRWVARALTLAGTDLSVAVRDRDAFAAMAGQWDIVAEVVHFDATDAHSVENVVDETAPDIVFNLAGYGVDRSERDAGLMWAMNRDLVDLVALALTRQPVSRWTGQRMVQAGSALEYGLLEGVAREDRGGMPHTLYGETRLAGTMALRDRCVASGLRGVTGRLFTVYGPGEHAGRLLPALMHAASRGSPVSLNDGSPSRDFAYVEDVASSLVRLGVSAAEPGEWVNVGTGRMRTVGEFALESASVLRIPVERLRFGEEETRPDEMRITGVDVSRLRSLIGSTPSDDVREGVARAAAFVSARRQIHPSGGLDNA